MKQYFLILVLVITSCAGHTYLDESGKEISRKEFLNTFKDVNNFTTWNYYAPDTGQVSQIVKPKYSALTFNYPVFKEKIEEITNRKFEDKTFLILYDYLNDQCTRDNNKLTKNAIALRKKSWAADKLQIENWNKELIILNFYEEGFALANSLDSPDEYFFLDNENFLRKTLFKTRAFCGSVALIKPNGEVLIYNGETNLWYFVQHARPEYWSIFFPEEVSVHKDNLQKQ